MYIYIYVDVDIDIDVVIFVFRVWNNNPDYFTRLDGTVRFHVVGTIR